MARFIQYSVEICHPVFPKLLFFQIHLPSLQFSGVEVLHFIIIEGWQKVLMLQCLSLYHSLYHFTGSLKQPIEDCPVVYLWIKGKHSRKGCGPTTKTIQ